MLELANAATVFVFPLGLLWFTMGLAVCLGIKVDEEKRPYLLLLLCLVIFFPLSRFPVFVMCWIDTTWELGTHYGIFEDWRQALFSQLLWGSVIQVIPGFLLGSATLSIKRGKGDGKRRVIRTVVFACPLLGRFEKVG